MRKKLIDEDGRSHVDFENASVDICLKILTLKGLLVVTEVEEID